MANKLQIMRGLKSKISNKLLSLAEPYFCTDTHEMYIGTGSGNVNMGGSLWYKGTAMSGTVTTTGYYSYSACPQVKVGDTYLNTSNGNIYECTTAGSGTTAKWTYKGCIKGAQGAKGDKGDKGDSIIPWNPTTLSMTLKYASTNSGYSLMRVGSMYSEEGVYFFNGKNIDKSEADPTDVAYIESHGGFTNFVDEDEVQNFSIMKDYINSNNSKTGIYPSHSYVFRIINDEYTMWDPEDPDMGQYPSKGRFIILVDIPNTKYNNFNDFVLDNIMGGYFIQE